MKDGSIMALLAVKAVCCVGLLLALGAFSVGSILAFLGNGWVQAGGAIIAAAGLARYLWIQRQGLKPETESRK
jgi:protein-S-isoprenylcysteine O-methyltransferase Ste14